MLIVVTVAGGGGFVAAADALPGERLYGMKLVGEDVRERLTLSSEQRFVVQASHASRRLDETERLLELQGIGGGERAELVRTAMDRYQDQLFAMNEIAVRFEPDPKRQKRKLKALQAAESMVDRHVQLMESTSRVEPAMAGLMLDPANAVFTLEADMFAAIPADEGGTDGELPRRKERAKWIEDNLTRLRAELEARRASESMDGAETQDGSGIPADDGAAEASIEAGAEADAHLQSPLEIEVGM
jgi:hypothetical protein